MQEVKGHLGPQYKSSALYSENGVCVDISNTVAEQVPVTLLQCLGNLLFFPVNASVKPVSV